MRGHCFFGTCRHERVPLAPSGNMERQSNGKVARRRKPVGGAGAPGGRSRGESTPQSTPRPVFGAWNEPVGPVAVGECPAPQGLVDRGNVRRDLRDGGEASRREGGAERRRGAGFDDGLRDLARRVEGEEALGQLATERRLEPEQELDPLQAAQPNLTLKRRRGRDGAQGSRPAELQGELAEDLEDALENGSRPSHPQKVHRSRLEGVDACHSSPAGASERAPAGGRAGTANGAACACSDAARAGRPRRRLRPRQPHEDIPEPSVPGLPGTTARKPR